MDDYKGGWGWKRIVLVSITLIALSFSVYYLFLQPGEIEPATNKCNPFPAKINGYICDGIKKQGILGENFFIVCVEHDDGNCIKQGWFPPKNAYLISYNNSGADAHLSYIPITFESAYYAELFSKKYLTLFEDLSSNVSRPEELIRFSYENVSINGAKGFFLDETLNYKYTRGFLLQDGGNVIIVVNDAKSQEDLLGFSELRKLILNFRKYEGGSDQG